MHAIDLKTLPVVGALDSERTATGITFWRRPAWAQHQVVDAGQRLGLSMPAGVRLELTTASPWVELDVMVTAVEVVDVFRPSVRVDLVVDGELTQSLPPTSAARMLIRRDRTFELVAGQPCTLRFDLPASPDVPVELWLPHNAMVELRAVRVADGCELAPHASGRRSWLHYGSSISHCLEAPSPTQTWPALVARAAGLDLTNLAVGGQCMLDPHVARTIRDRAPDVISLKVGINIAGADAVRERVFTPLLHGFLDTIREGLPRTPIVVVTAVECPVLETSTGPLAPAPDGQHRALPRAPELSVGTLTLQRTRELIGDVVQSRRGAGDQDLHLVDGQALLGPADVTFLHDGLHPDAEGYRVMAQRFGELVFGPDGVLAEAGTCVTTG